MFEQLNADLRSQPCLVAGAVSTEAVKAIEEFAGFGLPPSYKEFVVRYGAALVGPYPVFGSGAAEAMADADASVIDVTMRYRADKWPSTRRALVISTDHAGNPFTMDWAGYVRRFDHDAGEVEIISKSFEGFVDWCLSR